MENKIRNFTSVIKCYSMNGLEYYKITENGITSFVPSNPANTDYQAIQKWIAEGNTVIDNGGNN